MRISFYASNQQVEATAPRRCSFDRDMFHYVIVPGGAALPGAVPHLGRSAFFSYGILFVRLAMIRHE
jgi:hypothetical protein